MQHDCTACYSGQGCNAEPVGHLGGIALYTDPSLPEDVIVSRELFVEMIHMYPGGHIHQLFAR